MWKKWIFVLYIWLSIYENWGNKESCAMVFWACLVAWAAASGPLQRLWALLTPAPPSAAQIFLFWNSCYFPFLPVSFPSAVFCSYSIKSPLKGSARALVFLWRHFHWPGKMSIFPFGWFSKSLTCICMSQHVAIWKSLILAGMSSLHTVGHRIACVGAAHHTVIGRS